MAFEELKERVSGTEMLPVSIRLTNNNRPRVIIALRKSFAESIDGFKKWTACSVQIGSGEHAGKLRLLFDSKGVFAVRHTERGGAIIDLGYVAAIGTAPCELARTSATALDPSCIEIDIPEFEPLSSNEEQADESEADESEEEVAHDDDSTDGAPPAPKSADTFNGITVDLTDDAEHITYRGVTVEVTKRQAKFLFLLAKNKPDVIAERTALNALWDGKPPIHAGDVLKQIVSDLGPLLKPLKLALNAKAGGHQLVEL